MIYTKLPLIFNRHGMHVTQLPPLQTNDICSLLCYEWIFPEAFRLLSVML